MIGSTVSHYKIIEKLGEGGMGVVYKAQDTRLGRQVALKFLPDRLLSSANEKERFLQEAKSASSLNHPNVATVYEIDETSGQMFIAMEYIDGKTLRDMVSGPDQSPLALQQVLNIGAQIAAGLSAAHKKGIVHRDIKPENIIFTAEGVVKLTDFGLALPLHMPEPGGQEAISGTVLYMSPEQIQGDRADVSSDIWSLGVVLYELVTGRAPFGGEYEQAVMYTILHERQSPIPGFRKDVPPSLEHLIDRCLEKSPSRRFADIGSLLADLRKIGMELNKASEPATYSIAVLPFSDLSPEKDNKYFSDGLTEEIITNLSKLRNLKVISRTSVMRYERVDKSTKQISAELGVQYLLEGSVRKQGSDLRITTQLIDADQDASLWAEKYSGTMDEVFDIQEKVATRVVRALKLHLTPDEKKNLKKRATKNTEAYQLYLKGRFFWNKRTKEGLEHALRFFEQAIEIDSKYALAWAGLADSYNLYTEYANVARSETYPKARAAVEKALKFDNNLAEAHTSLASLLMLYQWDWANAEKEFELAIRLNPRYATARHWYGEWLLFVGRLEEALREITLAVELDPLSPAILKDMGVTLYYVRRNDEALEYGRKTLELDPSFASAHRLLSLAYLGKEMYEEAIAENQRWADLGGNPDEVSVALGQLYAASGNRAGAGRILESVLKISPMTGNLSRGIALVYAALGEKEQAFEWLEKTYRVQAESLSSMKVDPKLDMLKSDPRFTQLMERVGINR